MNAIQFNQQLKKIYDNFKSGSQDDEVKDSAGFTGEFISEK